MANSLHEKIFSIMEKHPLTVMATITEDGKPWVRYVACSADKNLTVRFATFKNSRKVKQVKMNPEVHMTMGASGSSDMGPYIQFQGKASTRDDKEIRHEFWSDGLKNYFQGPDDPNYVVMIVEPYRIEYMDETFKTQVWEK